MRGGPACVGNPAEGARICGDKVCHNYPKVACFALQQAQIICVPGEAVMGGLLDGDSDVA